MLLSAVGYSILMISFTKLPRQRYDPNALDGFESGRDFALGTGKALMWLSQLAYETDEPDKIIDVLQSWGLQLVVDGIIIEDVGTALPVASTRCFVATGRGATLIAFAGTDPLVLANWITDFDAHIDRTQTARGYQVATDAVWQRLRSVISKTAPITNKVFVAGHSLGGVLAALTALNIDGDCLADVVAVYTFGMPRPGSKLFADRQYNPRLGSRTYRLVHGNDLVATLAPSWLGFHHVGRYLRCERGSKFDPAKLTAESSWDESQFISAMAQEFQDVFQDPIAVFSAQLTRLKDAAKALAFGA